MFKSIISLFFCVGCVLAQGPALSAIARSSFEEKSFSHDGVLYNYRILSPRVLEPGRRYPVLFFLHGAGERGSDNEVSLRYLPDLMAQEPYRTKFPAFVVVPQSRQDQRWVESDWAAQTSSRMRPQPSAMMSMALALLDRTLRDYPADLDRVYLAGISMGGYGAWEMAARRPGTFAALAPMCGGGDEHTARLLESLPVWAWHGADDPVVPPARSRNMIEAIRAVGGSPRYTELAGVKHDVFLKAIAPDSGLVAWMFEQHRGPARTDEANAKALRILCAGDSNTEAREFPGYRAYLKQELDRRGVASDFVGSKRGGEPASDPEHEGYSGEGIARIRQRVREGMIENFSPAVVLLLTGSNDLWKDVRSDRSPVSDERARELANALSEVVQDISRRKPQTRILVGLPATPANTPGVLKIYRETLAAKIAALNDRRVATVDMDGLPNDGVHYTDAGFRGIAARWAQAISGGSTNAQPIGSAREPGGVRVDSAPQAVSMFDFAEIAIAVDKPSALNPFTDVALKCEFTDPKGERHSAEGFSDSADGSRFLVRIMPQLSGSYQWRIDFSQGDFKRSFSGGFQAGAGKLRGPVRVDREHPEHFLYEGSADHYYWNSTTTYALSGWRDEAIIRESLDRLARYHINRVRVAIVPPRVPGATQWKEPAIVNDGWFSFCVNAWPAQRLDDVDDPGFNPHRFNIDYWRRYERLVAYARELGIQVSVIFYVDGKLPGVDPFRAPAMGGDLEQLYYRYAVARLAAYSNVMWDLANEYRQFRNDQWAALMGNLVRKTDPYGHLTSIHGHGDFRFRTEPWIDFAMYQSWDEHGAYSFMLKNRREQSATGRVIPQVNEEYGYEDHYPFPWGESRLWPARIADSRSRIAWSIAMAGGYQTTGERANVPGYGGWTNGRGSPDMTMLKLYSILYEFWTAREWWRMQPLEGIGPEGVPCIGIAGEEYIFYSEHGEAVRLQVPSLGYRARWFDTRSGSYTDAGAVRSEKWISPSAPDHSDWVLVVAK